MSIKESDFIPDLFLPENLESSFLPSTYNDNLNDLFSDLTQNPPKKDIKFVLTKEEYPHSFLKKKINLKTENGDWGVDHSNGGRWSKEEQHKFAEAVFQYGNEWKKIQSHISSRNLTQIRSHAQKFLMKLKETNFYKSLNLDMNLSWTKVMNYIRSNVEFNVLKEILFSVEQNEEKNVEKKSKKKTINKRSKKNKLELSLNLSNESNCDTNNESSHFFFDSDESFYENNKKEEEIAAFEKFIESFNRTSKDINLNSSFDDISNQNIEDY
jgi:SHAQKYF class myb-like DNA-binding protein